MKCPHGDLLKRKQKGNPVLNKVHVEYLRFVETAQSLSVTKSKTVRELVRAINRYRSNSIAVFEGGKNVPQENLRSTILEEFLSWLFKDIFEILDAKVPSNYKVGKSFATYLNLTFAPKNFLDCFRSPSPFIGTKDQDFALGPTVSIAIEGSSPNEKVVSNVLLPVVAIECKTYLAKNHLDMCASTASSLRIAMPYCMYLIVAEFLKMDQDVTPEFTDVSEIFILCKAENSDRKRRQKEKLPPHVIDEDVVVELFEMVVRHLKAIWWDPKTALQRGRIIGRPI